MGWPFLPLKLIIKMFNDKKNYELLSGKFFFFECWASLALKENIIL